MLLADGAPAGTVELHGADFAWWSRAWAALPDLETVDTVEAESAAKALEQSKQLRGVCTDSELSLETDPDSARASQVGSGEVRSAQQAKHHVVHTAFVLVAFVWELVLFSKYVFARGACLFAACVRCCSLAANCM